MTEKDKQIQDQAIRIRELEHEIEVLKEEMRVLDKTTQLAHLMGGPAKFLRETPEGWFWCEIREMERDEHESTDS